MCNLPQTPLLQLSSPYPKCPSVQKTCVYSLKCLVMFYHINGAAQILATDTGFINTIFHKYINPLQSPAQLSLLHFR